MRHHLHHHREEISNEGVFSNPLALLENPALFENPLSGGAKVAIGVGVLAALGVGAYFIFKPKAAATSAVAAPAVATAGPYTPVTTMQQGETYLFSAPPIPGTTLATAVSALQTASAASPNVATVGKFTVLQSWDVGQVPANWPSSDSNANEWRMVLTLSGGTQPVPAPMGGNVFSTGGAVAGVGYHPSVHPSHYRGTSAPLAEVLRRNSRNAGVGEVAAPPGDVGYQPSVHPSHYRETSAGLTEMLRSSTRLAGVGALQSFVHTGPTIPAPPHGCVNPLLHCMTDSQGHIQCSWGCD